jgi:hypothetical protein
MGKFNRDEVADLLVKCHRRCCICHRFCGFKMETDHIKPSDEGGTDEIDNAIPVCLECHAEIHCYNPTHPRGRKFTEAELKKHKKQWLSICESKPEIFAQALPTSEVGPLNSLVDELEYNLEACECSESLLSVEQFNEAMRRGAISFLEPGLKDTINSAYAKINQLNQWFDSLTHQDIGRHRGVSNVRTHIKKVAPETKSATEKAHAELMKFLERDTDN